MASPTGHLLPAARAVAAVKAYQGSSF
eukprot:COSAG04_NODE_17299_length_473_cov_0.657754_2_plen_26_part_01